MEDSEKRRNFALAIKKRRDSLLESDKYSLATDKHIGVWCNGNTADSGPAFSGSSPDTPTLTKEVLISSRDLFFYLHVSLYIYSCLMIFLFMLDDILIQV